MLRKFLMLIALLFACQNGLVMAARPVHSSVYLMDKKFEIQQNIKIVKNSNGYYGVIDSKNKKELIPCKYAKIEKLGVDTVKVKINKSDKQEWKILTNNNLPVMNTLFEKVEVFPIDNKKPKTVDNSIFVGIYGNDKIAQISIPSHSSKDFIKNIFEQNNKYSWIKFHNYPTQGTLVFKHKEKYGLITTKDDDYFMFLPNFKEVVAPDANTSIYKQFGISYSDIENIKVDYGNEYKTISLSGKIDKFSYWPFINISEPYIDETIEIKNDELHFTFKNISFPNKNLYYLKHMENYKPALVNNDGKILSASKDEKYVQWSDKSLQSYYNAQNEGKFVKFYNYPKNGIYVRNFTRNADIFEKNGNKLKINPELKSTEYADNLLYFPDSNTLIYKLLNISFSNPDRILVRNGDKKWGIIDKNNNVIVDCQYDSIITLNAKDKSEVKYDDKNIYVTYKNIEIPYEDLVMVTKEGLTGVINKDGKILILKERYDKNAILNELSKNNSGFAKGLYIHDTKENRDKMREKLIDAPFNALVGIHFCCIFLPVIIVTTPVWPLWFVIGDTAIGSFLLNSLN